MIALRTLLSVGFFGVLSGTARADLDCDAAKAKIAEGVSVDLTIEGRSIFDPTIVKRKTMNLLILPTPLEKPCNVSGSGLQIFLRKDLVARIGANSYAGAFVPESSGMQYVNYEGGSFSFPRSDNFKKRSVVAFFHAIPASIAKDLGFDSYEAPGASPYIDFVDLGGTIPFRSIVGSFLGIGSKRGQFYQAIAQEVDVSLANPGH